MSNIRFSLEEEENTFYVLSNKAHELAISLKSSESDDGINTHYEHFNDLPDYVLEFCPFRLVGEWRKFWQCAGSADQRRYELAAG